MKNDKYKKLSIKRLITNPTCLNNFLKEQEWELYSNTPKIEKEPQLRDFNLSEEIIETNNKRKKKNEKIRNSYILLIFSLCWLYCTYLMASWDINNNNATSTNFFLYIACSFFVLILPFSFLCELFSGLFKFESKTDKQYKEYIYFKNAYNWQQKLKERKYWEEMSGRDFEYAVANYFKSKGFEANITQCSNDGGIDIILTLNNEISYVQCKHYQKNVGIAPARELYGVMQANNVNQGYLVTLNGFTKNVYNFAKDKNIKLLTVDDILA